MSGHADRYCPLCGEAIPDDHPHARFWPPACAQAAKQGRYRQRYRNEMRRSPILIGSAKIRICLRCDAPFPSTSAGHRFCALCRHREITVDERMMCEANVASGWPRWAP